MESIEQTNMRAEARVDFDKARRRAVRAEIGSKITGKQNRLIPFDEVRAELRQQNPLYRGVQQVPVDSIIGSVGRYRDFNRKFLPLTDTMRERWINVQTLASSTGWPPIELYKVGDAYFVRDGNHRTAIARQMGNRSIEAHVWEFPSSISLVNVESLDEALIALGQSEFEELTDISNWAPSHDIKFTAPGRYSELLVQIADIKHKMEQLDKREMSFQEAAQLWYELVYLPTIAIIVDSPLSDAFTGRTIADIFVWMSIHRSKLADLYGDYDNLSDLAAILVERYRPSSVGNVARQMRNLIGGDRLPHMTDVTEVQDSSSADEAQALLSKSTNDTFNKDSFT